MPVGSYHWSMDAFAEPLVADVYPIWASRLRALRGASSSLPHPGAGTSPDSGGGGGRHRVSFSSKSGGTTGDVDTRSEQGHDGSRAPVGAATTLEQRLQKLDSAATEMKALGLKALETNLPANEEDEIPPAPRSAPTLNARDRARMNQKAGLGEKAFGATVADQRAAAGRAKDAPTSDSGVLPEGGAAPEKSVAQFRSTRKVYTEPVLLHQQKQESEETDEDDDEAFHSAVESSPEAAARALKPVAESSDQSSDPVARRLAASQRTQEKEGASTPTTATGGAEGATRDATAAAPSPPTVVQRAASYRSHRPPTISTAGPRPWSPAQPWPGAGGADRSGPRVPPNNPRTTPWGEPEPDPFLGEAQERWISQLHSRASAGARKGSEVSLLATGHQEAQYHLGEVAVEKHFRSIVDNRMFCRTFLRYTVRLLTLVEAVTQKVFEALCWVLLAYVIFLYHVLLRGQVRGHDGRVGGRPIETHDEDEEEDYNGGEKNATGNTRMKLGGRHRDRGRDRSGCDRRSG
eukprot:g11378.t1